ncbi:MAG TPA: hypothetical protein VF712_03000 [Thermoleophilaceae bacterium]|jgi:hypothetical protein
MPEQQGVAASASTRVAEILEEAERHGQSVNEQAERAAQAAHREAEQEVERILADAREAARAAARERVERLAGLQAALARRGPALLEGLEGAGVTRARLEALAEALAASAERVVAEVEHGEVAAEAGWRPETATGAGERAEPEPETAAAEEAEPEEAEPEPDAAAGEDAEPESTSGLDDDDPVAIAEELAQPVAGASPANDSAPVRYDGSLPEGAPIARKPLRSRERDARFAALLLAVQGRDRGDVATHLRKEYGYADCEPILDEVFGPTAA